MFLHKKIPFLLSIDFKNTSFLLFVYANLPFFFLLTPIS